MYENVRLRIPGKVSSEKISDSTGRDKNNGRSLVLELSLSFVILVIGIGFLYAAEDDLSSVVFAIIFLVLGSILISACKGNKYEYRTYILSYSICVLITGLSFTHSLGEFNNLMSTIDSAKFLKAINSSATTADEIIMQVDSVLPVIVWKELNTIRQLLDIGDNGPGIYVLFNAMIVALAGVFVTKTANELFENDDRRLRLIGTIFALCGMNWLFGSLLLRDGFALLLNTLSVWVLVKVLVTPNGKNLILSIGVIAIVAWLMLYIRDKSFYLFFLFALMAFGLWYIRLKFSPTKIIMVLIVLASGVVAYDQFISQASLATEATAFESEKYTAGSSATAASDSLGVSLVVNQPLPVRLVVGSAYVLIYPIPIWGYFRSHQPEYFLIKGWHGIFMVLLMPYAIYSSVRIFSRAARKNSLSSANLFIFLYFLLTASLVGITTLETRHHGQFLAAFLILSSMPVFNSNNDRNMLKLIRVSWFGLIIGGHVLWMVLKL